MTAGLAAGTANHNGPAIKRACRALGIKPTRKGILAYLAPKPPRPYDECRRMFADECRRLAELADALYRQCLTRRLYLYGRRDGIDTARGRADCWTALTIAGEETPAGFKIVHGEHLSYARTVQALAADIETILRREPLWIFAE
jgi:hypothetical protein